MARAWVFNLAAEFELGSRTASRAVRLRSNAIRQRLALRLPEGDVVVGLHPDRAACGLRGEAWCPTPSAVERLRAVGATVLEPPPLEVLRRVNDRAFATRLLPLEGARICESVEELCAVVSGGGRWLARRGLGFAGTGVRRLEGCSAADAAWARASLRLGTLVVEPWVEVSLSLASHGHTDGRRGALTVQRVDAKGQWRASRRAQGNEVSRAHRATLAETVELVCQALRGADYFGPFGVDAFLWRDARGAVRLHPLSEINARYSMGWPVGMGGW